MGTPNKECIECKGTGVQWVCGDSYTCYCVWAKKIDSPENPSHYSDLNPEPLDVIERWRLPFHEAQVLKYIARAGRKGGEEKRVEDLKKARVYLDRRIKQLEGK